MKPPSPTEPAEARRAEALRERLASRPWRVLRSGPATGAENMALDAALLDAAAAEEIPPTLRFYTWSPPAVSLGRFQGTEGIDLSYLAAREWDLVRRPTGGRAVLHHLELTYAVVLPPSVVAAAGVRTSYRVLSTALNAGIRCLIPLPPLPQHLNTLTPQHLNTSTPNCFALACECDSVVPEGKLVGSAQVRKDGALLQHGSILLDAEPEAWEALFGTAGRLVTLRQFLGEAPTDEVVMEAVCSGFRSLDVQLPRS